MLDSGLLPQLGGLIAGKCVGADSGESFPVINPANGDLLANVPSMAGKESVRAIECAATAMNTVVPLPSRKQWLCSIGNVLLQQKQELGRIITLEHGTPRQTNKLLSRSSTSSLFSFLATSIAKHSRVYSSMSVNMRDARPSLVRSATKS